MEQDLKPSNVVPFKPVEKPALSIKHVERPHECWPHHLFVFDEKARTVECSKCSRVFTPFDALMEVARDWDQLVRNRKFLQQQCKELGEQRDALKREVQNLKAQRRRLA